ncbi:MAG: DNA polymerase III subunit gamma/tau [Chloroflexia bacterium]
MSQSLYRKYRSRTFDELVGQEHVTRTLTNAVASGKIAHAYLSAGPRGTGKTSTARLLAKAVNCTFDGPRPCNECAACTSINRGQAMDLIEIDAASRRKVEDVAEIIERVNFAPAELRYKVYIIDEVHMLTAHAFNALLKTLEEPPESAIFMLATTEVWKVFVLISRASVRSPIPAAEVVARLEHVAAAEGCAFSRRHWPHLATSTGSLRDALGLLDQPRSTRRRGQPSTGCNNCSARSAAVASPSLWTARRPRRREGALSRQWREDNGRAPVHPGSSSNAQRAAREGLDGATDLTHEVDDLRAGRQARPALRARRDERFSGLDYTLRTGRPRLPAARARAGSRHVLQPQPREAADEAVARPNPRAAASSSPARRSGLASGPQNPPMRTPRRLGPRGRSALDGLRRRLNPAPPRLHPHDGPLDLAAVQAAWPRVLDVLKVTNRTPRRCSSPSLSRWRNRIGCDK